MFTPNTKRIGASAFFVAVLSTAVIAQSAPPRYGFGTKVDSAELLDCITADKWTWARWTRSTCDL